MPGSCSVTLLSHCSLSTVREGGCVASLVPSPAELQATHKLREEVSVDPLALGGV